jgi:hypothetical protein
MPWSTGTPVPCLDGVLVSWELETLERISRTDATSRHYDTPASSIVFHVRGVWGA